MGCGSELGHLPSVLHQDGLPLWPDAEQVKLVGKSMCDDLMSRLGDHGKGTLQDGKLSLGTFVQDYEALSKSPLPAATKDLLTLALPVMREEAARPQERAQLLASLFPGAQPPLLTPGRLSLPTTTAPAFPPLASGFPPLTPAPAGPGRKRKLPPSLTAPGGPWAEALAEASPPGPAPATPNGSIDVWAWYSEEWRQIENVPFPWPS